MNLNSAIFGDFAKVVRVKGEITINGVKYPVENFTIEWNNDLQPFYYTGSNLIDLYSPYTETEEQRDKRLNPRKYDSCKFCDHYRFRHESNYGKCTGTDFDDNANEYAYEEIKCECKEFV